MDAMTAALQRLGALAMKVLQGFGHAAFFFWDLLVHAPAALKRFSLVVRQIHAIGNLSLVIILASVWPWVLCWRCRCTTRWSPMGPRSPWA